jgi:pimeloyl-[acyl-carrier protein] methyl ester esterase
LEILRNADLRELLPQIEQPILVIFGERDKLTPPEASYFLARTMKNARLLGIDGAAHAPFLSHSKIFIEHVRSFLHERV